MPVIISNGMKKIKVYAEYIAIWVLRTVLNVFNLFPIKKNRIMFYSFNGKQYSCNPKCVSDALLNDDGLEIYWAFKDPDKFSGSLPDDFLIDYMAKPEFNEDLLEPLYVDAGRLDWTSDIKMVLGLIARGTSKTVLPNLVPWDEYNDYATVTDDILENKGISTDRMCEILERLKNREVIEKMDGNQNKYRIKIPLCREWILRRGGSAYGNK